MLNIINVTDQVAKYTMELLATLSHATPDDLIAYYKNYGVGEFAFGEFVIHSPSTVSRSWSNREIVGNCVEIGLSEGAKLIYSATNSKYYVSRLGPSVSAEPLHCSFNESLSKYFLEELSVEMVYFISEAASRLQVYAKGFQLVADMIKFLRESAFGIEFRDGFALSFISSAQSMLIRFSNYYAEGSGRDEPWHNEIGIALPNISCTKPNVYLSKLVERFHLKNTYND